MSEPIVLSILVCGLYERVLDSGNHVLRSLEDQAAGAGVEVLTLYDNRKMTVGRKRSILLSIAQGAYFTFVDDDDRVADDYVERILRAIADHPVDVITFRQECRHADTGLVESCRYGLTLPYSSTPTGPKSADWTGLPAHTMCWRTEAVQDLDFPDGDFGEDVGWVARARKRAVTEYEIPNWTGYYYTFDPLRSRTRGR